MRNQPLVYKKVPKDSGSSSRYKADPVSSTPQHLPYHQSILRSQDGRRGNKCTPGLSLEYSGKDNNGDYISSEFRGDVSDRGRQSSRRSDNISSDRKITAKKGGNSGRSQVQNCNGFEYQNRTHESHRSNPRYNQGTYKQLQTNKKQTPVPNNGSYQDKKGKYHQ